MEYNFIENIFLHFTPILSITPLFQGGQDAGAGQGLGSMVQSFLQTDGGKQLGEVFGGQGADILGNIGALLAGGGSAGGGGGGLNPQLIGHMVDMFSGMAAGAKEDYDVDHNNNNEVIWNV